MINQPQTDDIDAYGMIVDVDLDRRIRALCAGRSVEADDHAGQIDCHCEEMHYLADLGFERAILSVRRFVQDDPDPPFDLWDALLMGLFGASAAGLFRLVTAEQRMARETV